MYFYGILMTIAIFGASGPTGKVLVRQALDQGHNVTAFVRSPETFSFTHAALRPVKADALVASTFEEHLQGHHAVLSALGVGQSFGSTTIYSESGRNIVEAMRKHGVGRFICLTSGGVEDGDPAFGLVYKLVFKRLFRKPYNDMKMLEAYLQSVKDIAWSIVRPTQLTDAPPTGTYRVSPRYAPAGGVQISRGDLAQFMLAQIDSQEWVHKTPTLAY
jgi:putative NADH-flavin reductase